MPMVVDIMASPQDSNVEWYQDHSRILGWSAFVYDLPQPGKGHDGWSLRHNNAVVSDGATPLSEDWGEDLYHWTNTLTSFFAENGQDTSKSLESIWESSVEFVNSLYPPLGYRRTMGCSQVRFNNHMIEVLSVGDTKVAMHKTDGNFVEIFDTRLSRWEERADALIEKGKLTGPQAAWHNRLKVGQLDGYQVVADDPKVGSEALTYTIEEYKVDNIIIASDGLWEIFEHDLEKMFKVANSLNPKQLMERISKFSDITDDLTFIRLDRN